MKKKGLIICFSVIVLAMGYSSLVSAGTVSGVIGGGRAGTTWDGWTQFQNTNANNGNGEDWVRDNGRVAPGYGGQEFDAEYLFYQLEGTTLSIGLQTGYDLVDGQQGSPATQTSGQQYYAGDIALSFDGTSNYTHAIDFGLYTEDYYDGDLVSADVGSDDGIDTAGLYSVTGWNNDILFSRSSPFAMDDGSLVDNGIGGSNYGFDSFGVGSSYDTITGELSYYRQVSFDITDFLQGGVLSVKAHWTMSCGNDQIKGSFQEPPSAVPEPGTIALLGIGLAGLAGIGARRRLKKKAVNKS